MDKDLLRGREELVTRRVTHHGQHEPPAVNAAFMTLQERASALRESLSPEQSQLYRKMENAYYAFDGESRLFFYKAGMQDALTLLFERGDDE